MGWSDMRNGWFESEAERKAFYERQEAFWNRPSHEVIADLVLPGTPGSRVDYHRPGRFP
jgi:hypothetical protein